MKTMDFEKAFGFPADADFVRFINVLLEHGDSKHQLEAFGQLTDGVFFFRPSTDLWRAIGSTEISECRYSGTPLELIPIGDHGVDGAHFGFVVMAPECAACAVPIGEFNPMDFDGVVQCGKNFRDALEGFIGDTLEHWNEDPDAKSKHEKQYGAIVSKLVQELQLTPGTETRDMGWSTQEYIQFDVPKGYSFSKTDDGLGVLCPSKFLSAVPPVCENDLDKLIAESKRCCKKQLFGDALYCLRQAAWQFNADDKERSRIANEMIVVYEKLNRPLLARLAHCRANGEY